MLPKAPACTHDADASMLGAQHMLRLVMAVQGQVDMLANQLSIHLAHIETALLVLLAG